MSSYVRGSFCLILVLVAISFIPLRLHAAGPWDGPSFSASADSLRQSADAVKVGKDADATLLLNEERFSFDAEGKLIDSFHAIYRVETANGVKGWANVRSRWEPWHQSKPEVRARVITTDGVEHALDLKTLTDVPVHENSPDTYSDSRAYGGPLPAVAIGAIVEQEVVIRDTAPFFRGGLVQRLSMAKSVPVTQTRIVLSHPQSLAMRYFVHEMPDAKVSKSLENGIETIQIENGPMEPVRKKLTYLPSDVVPGPQIEFATGASWQQMAVEYARLSNEKLRAADVQPMLASLKSSRPASRKELIERLVSALHQSVRYTGVEFGEASIIPQFPSETLKRKYGDCKDKAALLVTMLRASGIPAKLALLDSGPGQDVNPELPGMGMFDHAIVYVPATGKDEELWIDATAQYSRVGQLPYMDYGRSALIVDETTRALKKTPELTAQQNLHREFREFRLAEYGHASIVERNEDLGPEEAGYRRRYADVSRELHDNVENYVKRAYLADELISIQHGDAADLSKQFWVSFTTKGKRGNTDYDNAVMAIRVEDLFNDFPDYFKTADDEKKDTGDKKTGDQPRVKDWQIHPFTNEWNYKIVAPPGYKLRALPQAREEQLGVGRFAQKYTSNADGTVVEAVLHFESGESRLTVAEAQALRDAIVKVRKSDPIFIAFDQVGQSLLKAGKVREGLASYQELIQLHPSEALHRVQLARALLSVGLGEKARVVAKEATVKEPGSAQAFSTLAWILEHDLIGRRMKKGFDYDGAVAAYRKAEALDPKDKDVRVNLAILLEYDASGERYTENAHLEDAVAEFTELRKLDAEYAATYDDNVLYDLWYAHDTKRLMEAVTRLPATNERRGFLVAMAGLEQGSDAAIKRSLELTTDEDGRSKVLTNAGWLLLRRHNYSVGADLLAAGAKGQDNEAQSAAYAAMLKKAVPRTQYKIDPSTPQSAMQKFFLVVFTRSAGYDQFKVLMSRNADRSLDEKRERESTNRQLANMRQQMEGSGVPLDILSDIVLPNMRFSVEGSDSPGYQVITVAFGADPLKAYVVREDGSYKVLEASVGANSVPENLGWQALQELKNNNLAGARKWLDWARDQVHINENDDPLAGQPFPHFWTKGHEGDATEIRKAALVLASSKELRSEDIADLIRMRDAATNQEEKARLDLVIAYAYRAQEMWPELVPVAERLAKAYPDSLTAFQLAATGYAGAGRLDDWQKLLDARIAKHPDELDYTRSAARLAQYRGDFPRSRQLMKTLIDRGQATESDLNEYAWAALYVDGAIDPDSIDAAERGNQQGKNSNFAVMHTLACLYARAGKPGQARDLLLKAMDAGNLGEPDSSIWLAYGMIAEQYGEADAARAMYARVEKLKTEVPTSNYQLAQQRIALLQKTGATTAAARR